MTTPEPVAVTPVKPEPSPTNVPVVIPVNCALPDTYRAAVGKVVPIPTFLLVYIPVFPAFVQVPALPALALRFVPSPKVVYISEKFWFTLVAPKARESPRPSFGVNPVNIP